MLSAFVFILFLSVPDAVAIRNQKGRKKTLRSSLRTGLPSDRRLLAGRQSRNQSEGDHIASNLTASAPIPGLQVSEHITREGLANMQPSLIHVADKKHHIQPSLVHVADKKHRSDPWTPFSASPKASLTPGMQYPYDTLTNQNLTFDQYNAAKNAAAADDNPRNATPIILALAGGTGASISGAGTAKVDRDLLRRMHYQDKAVMCLVLVVYMVALAFSVSLTYRQATNNSPVTYYADPRYNSLVMEGNDLDAFLNAFNQPPKNISLRVAGFVPVSDYMDGNIQWRGEHFQTAFTFSLDLSPWMVRETQTEDRTGSVPHTRSLQDGVLPEDRSRLNYTLTSATNDLEYIEIVKHVKWLDWEELASNIKHQIRQSGFNGVISVDRGHTDELQVYKNTAWANFMHARATRVLCALSIFGWVFYVPYMWIRCQSTSIRSYYRIDVGISEYWPLIAEQLTADGFVEHRPVPTVSNAPSPPAP